VLGLEPKTQAWLVSNRVQSLKISQDHETASSWMWALRSTINNNAQNLEKPITRSPGLKCLIQQLQEGLH